MKNLRLDKNFFFFLAKDSSGQQATGILKITVPKKMTKPITWQKMKNVCFLLRNYLHTCLLLFLAITFFSKLVQFGRKIKIQKAYWFLFLALSQFNLSWKFELKPLFLFPAPSKPVSSHICCSQFVRGSESPPS